MAHGKTRLPTEGEKITWNGSLMVPECPIIPFIEGDGTGPDIWRATVRVLDAAVAKAYAGKRQIIWHEVFAGEKAIHQYGENHWLPQETIDYIAEHKVAIKGPIVTGANARSVSVELRQRLDLYANIRPVQYFEGIPSPVKHPERVDMVLFRESTEDVHAGIECEPMSELAKKFAQLLEESGHLANVRFPRTTAYALKPVSREGSERLVRAAIEYALKHGRRSVTLVHKGDVLPCTEGAFCKWGYEAARKYYPQHTIAWEECGGNPPAGKLLIKDTLTDNFLQQILLKPEDYDVIATLNLNGDYIANALAAQVGGVGIIPGANVNCATGVALFEPTHGAAPRYANLDKANPSALILSGAMLLRHIDWHEAAQLVSTALRTTIAQKTVTYDLARLVQNATELKCSEFADAVIANLA